MTSSVLKKVGIAAALGVAALTVTPFSSVAAATGSDHTLSIDCDGDASEGGVAEYHVRAKPGDTISITNLGGCVADLANSNLVTTITPPGGPTIVYQVKSDVLPGNYTGVVGDLGSEWPIVIGTTPIPTSWIGITVPKEPATVTLHGPDNPVHKGKSVALKGFVEIPVGKQMARSSAGVQVKLYKKSDSGWHSIDLLRTTDGSFRFEKTVNKTSKFQARVEAFGAFKAGSSDPVAVRVSRAPKDKAVDAWVSKKNVHQGNEIVVTGACGKGCAGKAVQLQKRVNGAWKTFAHTKMNDRGRHNFAWDTVTRGTYKMRVVVKNWAKSKTVTFDVVR